MLKLYEYACHDCKLTWEKEYKFGQPAEKTKCPQCGKRWGQNWIGRTAPAVHFKGGLGAGWTTKGGGELMGSSDEMNKAMQEGVKNRMGQGHKDYATYNPPQEVFDNARKLNETEVQEKLQTAKKVTAANYDKAGLDPAMPHKPK